MINIEKDKVITLYENKKWYIKLLLLFKPFKYGKCKFNDEDRDFPFAIVLGAKYKILFGVKYIYSLYLVPLEHINCRCQNIPKY